MAELLQILSNKNTKIYSESSSFDSKDFKDSLKYIKLKLL